MDCSVLLHVGQEFALVFHLSMQMCLVNLPTRSWQVLDTLQSLRRPRHEVEGLNSIVLRGGGETCLYLSNHAVACNFATWGHSNAKSHLCWWEMVITLETQVRTNWITFMYMEESNNTKRVITRVPSKRVHVSSCTCWADDSYLLLLFCILFIQFPLAPFVKLGIWHKGLPLQPHSGWRQFLLAITMISCTIWSSLSYFEYTFFASCTARFHLEFAIL